MLDNDKARATASRVVDPIARGLLRIGLTPNLVTFGTSLIVSVFVLSTWSQGRFGLGLLLCVPLVFGDLLDGTMARLSGNVSPWGSFLDSVMDRVTDASILSALILYSAGRADTVGVGAGAACLATTGLIPYIRAKAESIGVECKVGLMERSERLFVLLLIGISGAFGFIEGIKYGLVLMAALNLFTVFQRLNAVRTSVSS